jgi:ubiquinone/menaquinone biosynthesis C-methylase UbiE
LAGKAASVVGIDVSPEATRHASDRYAAGNLRFVTASVAQIPLPDASFDVIVSFETIEHMTEHEAFMREIDRLLAPGGMLIISSPVGPNTVTRRVITMSSMSRNLIVLNSRLCLIDTFRPKSGLPSARPSTR